MKKLIFTALALLTAIGALQMATPTAQAGGGCDNVRCAACPTGFHPDLKLPDCCECVPD